MIGPLERGSSRTGRIFVRCVITPAHPSSSLGSPPRRGRPKKYASQAEKQKAWRLRKARLAEIAQIEKSAKRNGPLIMNEADHGKGRLVVGGHNLTKIEEMDAAHEWDFGKVEAKGHGPGMRDLDDYEQREAEFAEKRSNKRETAFTFMDKRTWKEFLAKSRPLGSTRLNRSNARFFCARHSFVPPETAEETAGAYQDSVTGRWVVTFAGKFRRKVGAWYLECGCVRENSVTPKIEPEEARMAAAD